MKRVALDSTGSLNGRLITVTGFIMKGTDGADLARVAIFCCAADAQLARLHLRGPAAATAATYPDNTWLRVEGQMVAQPLDSTAPSVPTLTTTSVTPIDAPANPYSY